mgnify:CR=1 FL=1
MKRFKSNTFIPLTYPFIATHVIGQRWHKNIDFDFIFLPIAKHEFLILYAKRYEKKIKNIPIILNDVLEFYLSTEVNQTNHGIIIRENDNYKINMNNIY